MQAANQAEILRAHQRDDEFLKELDKKLMKSLSKIKNKKILSYLQNNAVKLLYFMFTSGSGNLTLGEEYTGITQANLQDRQIVPINARLLCLLMELFGERELIKIVDKFKHSVSASTEINHKDNLINILNILRRFIPVAVVLQKCLFYLVNFRFSISQQITGIDYAKISGMTPTNDVNLGLKLLGLISLVQCVLQIRQSSISDDQDEDEDFPAGSNSINESSVKCQLCFSTKPSAVTPCGHLFCWNCLAEWVRVQSQCPSCREHFTSSRIVPLLNL
ncbi:peroxisome assembly protein 10-B [Microplitis demolitor]|uniref:peroxisome assembly protein 10-B n=1 Tax=Microplitis demolitor TaxID=69319 RepID=UPI0004CD33A4|nr:peroxisome assembly protein 10-B [Microplitis demolitor]